MAIQNMTLKKSTFAPSVFTPVEYKYQEEDLSILERSLAQREARRNQAIQQKTAVDQALSTIEQKLNPNEAEWFNNYKNNITNQISVGLDSDDYGAAFRTATMLAGDVAKDSAILSRIKANEDYTKWETNLQSKLDKGEISQDTYKWALAQNPYQFNENIVNGRIVGGQLVAPNQVYNTINWGDLAAKAAAFNRPDVISTTTTRNNDNPQLYDSNKKDGIPSIDGRLGSYKDDWSQSHQLEEITTDDIFGAIGAMLQIPDLKNQAIQDWQVNVWNYQQKLEDGRLDNADIRNLVEQGLWNNNAPVSLQQYLDEKAKLFLPYLAYKKDSWVDVKSQGFNLTNSTGGNGGENYDYNTLQGMINTLERGTQVEQSLNASENAANQAASDTDKRLSNANNPKP